MALAYRDVYVDEQELIGLVGFDPVSKSKVEGITIWGNPDKGFVGNIDGRMLVDGYGVYEGPIALAGSGYRKTQAFRGWTATQLAAQLESHNPVIVWGHLGSGKQYTWKTSDGADVQAVAYEHTFLAYGFRGNAQDPEGFYLVDPVYGPKYMEVGDFMDNWSALGYRGVVVY
jgi:uncharacterized protein YvpB